MARHIPRLYCETPLSENSQVRMSAQQAHHLLHVLRLKPGAELVLFDGRGGEFRARLCVNGKDRAKAEVGKQYALSTESGLRITLAQAVSRGERMDYCLQKAVELGAHEIQPLHTERSQKIAPSRQEKKLDHWRAVARSAAEQSGREVIPVIHQARPLPEWLPESPEATLKLLLDPEAGQRLGQLEQSSSVVLLSGPEGGFSPGEIEAARGAGFIGIRLGPRVLRTETAAVACVTALQTLWGDLGR